MANQEHLNRLLNEGVQAWNQWIDHRSGIQIDLSEANLHNANLSEAHLSGADFHNANLSEAHLSFAILSGADLHGINLRNADLSGTNLSEANVHSADLSYSDLSYSDLSGAKLNNSDLHKTNLSHSDLIRANLTGAILHNTNLRTSNLSNAFLQNTNLANADLVGANFSFAYLNGANLTNAKIWATIFVNIDLSEVKGLETIDHQGPSSIGIDTIYLSHGKIPDTFLKGAGVDDTFITYIHSLIAKPIDYYSCFISYSSKDQAFAERLYADLQSKNVRCWYAPHHMKIGEKIIDRIDESIRIYDKLLLILSRDSVESHWVEHEVGTALDKEREGHPNILFPVRIDETIMGKKIGWANHVRNTRHIGDFTHWKEHDAYQYAFQRLLHDLKQGI